MNITGIDRRHFIVIGSTAVAGLAVLPLGAQTAGSRPQVFVGFAPRVARSRAIGRSGAAIFAAETIATTEPSLARTGARFSFRGLQRRDAGSLKLHLDVMHQADGVEAQVPFQAWTYDASARGIKSSNPVGFTVPVDSVRPLDLKFVVSTGGADVNQRISFTVAGAEGAISLNSGSYIFAIAERAPDWSSLRIDGEKLTHGHEGVPVAFDYLILSVSSPAA